MRRWTKVTLLSTSLKQRTSSLSSSSERAAKIALPLGCAHQLPTMGCPATASATLGTGPRAEASTTPCFLTKASQRLPAVGLAGALRRARAGDARLDEARAGEARLDEAWAGEARLDEARVGDARRAAVGLRAVRLGARRPGLPGLEAAGRAGRDDERLVFTGMLDRKTRGATKR